jgi:hypothetical protein
VTPVGVPFFSVDLDDDSFRCPLGYRHYRYMRALTAHERIHDPCLSFRGAHLTTNLSCPIYHALFAVLSLRLLSCIFPYLSGLSGYRSIVHGILIRLPIARGRRFESPSRGKVGGHTHGLRVVRLALKRKPLLNIQSIVGLHRASSMLHHLMPPR